MMSKKRILLNLTTLILIQGIFFTYPSNSFGQWDSDRIKPPAPGVLLGGRVGYDWDFNTWNLGGQLRVPLGLFLRGLEIIPSGDVFFIKTGIDWQLNLDAALRLMMFYGGAGLAYLNRDFNTPDEKSKKIGTNYFLGMPLIIPKLPVTLFIEARWTNVQGEHLFRLMAGLNISLGSRRR